MQRAVFVLLMLAHPPPAAAVEKATEPAIHWLCRYVYDRDLSFIECMNEDADDALTDGPPRVKRLQIFTLPMSDEDIAFAEQLVDSVMCYNSTHCTASLTPPQRG